ncbi:MAG: hypothetical protein KBF35_06345 [Saprospiraceae bacterium]|jgi:hypothetical protein|nr:hypothetical protein [Saprospiraceae bacterium]
MAKLNEKYLIGKRLLEINIMIEKKYNLNERSSNYYEKTDLKDSGHDIEIPDDLLYFYSRELMLERLNSRFDEGTLTKADLDAAILCAQETHNESIGAYTEEFWLKVSEEGLPVKRKKNRLLNILKKGYLSLDIDKETFYDGIQELLDSDVFDLVYDENIRTQIFELIELTNQRLVNRIDKLLNKKNLSLKEMHEIWDINTDLEYYSSFLKIPIAKIQAVKNFIFSNDNYYQSFYIR